MANPKVMLLFGESGDGKTSQLIEIAKWFWEKKGKTCRYVGFDPGGSDTIRDAGLFEVGLVDEFNVGNRPTTLGDFRNLADGFWYRKTKKGDVFLSKVEECRTRPEQWAKVGCVFVDSLTGIANRLLGHIGRNNVQDPKSDQKIGYTPSFSWEEDGYKWTGVTQGHYGMVQGVILDAISMGFNHLPVDLVVYTARIGAGEERSIAEARKKDSTIPMSIVYGPKTAGSAIISELPAWVGDCLHLQRIQVESKNEPGKQVQKLAAWYMKHSIGDVTYLAKSRVTPEKLGRLMEKFPGGFIPLGVKYPNGISKYLDFLEEMKDSGVKELQEWMKMKGRGIVGVETPPTEKEEGEMGLEI